MDAPGPVSLTYRASPRNPLYSRLLAVTGNAHHETGHLSPTDIPQHRDNENVCSYVQQRVARVNCRWALNSLGMEWNFAGEGERLEIRREGLEQNSRSFRLIIRLIIDRRTCNNGRPDGTRPNDLFTCRQTTPLLLHDHCTYVRSRSLSFARVIASTTFDASSYSIEEYIFPLDISRQVSNSRPFSPNVTESSRKLIEKIEKIQL